MRNTISKHLDRLGRFLENHNKAIIKASFFFIWLAPFTWLFSAWAYYYHDNYVPMINNLVSGIFILGLTVMWAVSFKYNDRLNLLLKSINDPDNVVERLKVKIKQEMIQIAGRCLLNCLSDEGQCFWYVGTP